MDPRSAAFGISDALADPTLELRDGSGALLFQNDNWQDDPRKRPNSPPWVWRLRTRTNRASSPRFCPALYTAILAGKNGGTGVGLVEIYDTNSAAADRNWPTSAPAALSKPATMS